MTLEELTAQLDELKKKNVELENQLVDKADKAETKYVDPVHDNKDWQEFKQKIKERGR